MCDNKCNNINNSASNKNNNNAEPPSTKSHKHDSKTLINFAVLTISTSKYEGRGDDRSGIILKDSIEKSCHTVKEKGLVSDEKDMIIGKVTQYLKNPQIDIIITTGGTGLAKRDITIESLKPLFEKELTGFNSLFMHLSYEAIGSACVLSRATAGTIGKKAIFCLPGSPDACSLAMEKIILKEAGHILKHAGE